MLTLKLTLRNSACWSHSTSVYRVMLKAEYYLKKPERINICKTDKVFLSLRYEMKCYILQLTTPPTLKTFQFFYDTTNLSAIFLPVFTQYKLKFLAILAEISGSP
jgi:hypothetical protein